MHGQQLLSSSFDTTLRLWDLNCERDVKCHDGTCAPSLIGHGNFINGLWPLQTADKVLSWSQDHSLRLFSLDSGKCEQLLLGGADEKVDIDEEWQREGHTGSVSSCFVYADDTRALSCSEDCHMIVWDIDQTAQHLRSRFREVLDFAAEKKRHALKAAESRPTATLGQPFCMDTEQLFEDFFKEFDRDANARLDFEEFKTAARAVDISTSLMSNEKLWKLFCRVGTVETVKGSTNHHTKMISIADLKHFVE
eukprot:SAG25_NODE_3195_length_1178_cov_3.479147_1_plen_250_part_10